MCRSRLYLSLSIYIYLYKRDDTWRLRGNKRRMESKLLRKNNLAPRKALSSSCGDPWGNWPRKRLVDWTRIFSFSPSLLGPARRLFISCNLFDVSAAAVASDWTLMLMATAAPRSAQLGLSPGSRVWAPEAVSFLFFFVFVSIYLWSKCSSRHLHRFISPSSISFWIAEMPDCFDACFFSCRCLQLCVVSINIVSCFYFLLFSFLKDSSW